MAFGCEIRNSSNNIRVDLSSTTGDIEYVLNTFFGTSGTVYIAGISATTHYSVCISPINYLVTINSGNFFWQVDPDATNTMFIGGGQPRIFILRKNF